MMNTLLCVSTPVRVDERVIDIGVIHVQIATEDTLKHSFHCLDPSPVYGACGKPVIRVN
jgi:hypothetical protein